MKCRVQVTFEYILKPPDRHVVELLEAGQVQTIAARAIREAKKAVRPMAWSSLVCLIERLGPVDAIADAETDDATDETEPAAVGIP
jgi:hypothetical protein